LIGILHLYYSIIIASLGLDSNIIIIVRIRIHFRVVRIASFFAVCYDQHLALSSVDNSLGSFLEFK